MVEAMQLVAGVLAVVAAIGTVALVFVRLIGPRAGRAWQLASQVVEHRLGLIAAIGVAATLGSLYFSEVAEMVPCRLCWFQRVFMYPIGVVGVVAAFRRDGGARWYLGSLAAIGAAISAYHTVIEWRPQLDSGSCELFGPACTVIYFRTFGVLSLATMALIGFVAVLVLCVTRFDVERSA